MDALLASYSEAQASMGPDWSGSVLAAVAGALRLARPTLAYPDNDDILATELAGRLHARPEAHLQDLVKEARAFCRSHAAKPLFVPLNQVTATAFLLPCETVRALGRPLRPPAGAWWPRSPTTGRPSRGSPRAPACSPPPTPPASSASRPSPATRPTRLPKSTISPVDMVHRDPIDTK